MAFVEEFFRQLTISDLAVGLFFIGLYGAMSFPHPEKKQIAALLCRVQDLPEAQ